MIFKVRGAIGQAPTMKELAKSNELKGKGQRDRGTNEKRLLRSRPENP
ncbi:MULTISPECIES: hypothetical protein [Spirulina sp. CCY15215]|nr:hypothetical protein [Spirulina major]